MPDLPEFPVYVPSKGRADRGLTARALLANGVPFSLVVEPAEESAYRAAFPTTRVLVLPTEIAGTGSSVPARNWIRAHSIAAGAARHWQLDDNIRGFYTRSAGRRQKVHGGMALRAVEMLVARYRNVAVAGLNYNMFGFCHYPAFFVNTHVYSCTLALNALPYGWRGRYNEDTDLCLRVLADGWCTIAVNAYLACKEATMTMRGGNAGIYQGDGRLRMARELERRWPGVVHVGRRWGRPQHWVNWRRFTTPLVPAESR